MKGNLDRLIGLAALRERLRFLGERYEAWKHVTSFLIVDHDEAENRVHAPDWVGIVLLGFSVIYIYVCMCLS